MAPLGLGELLSAGGMVVVVPGEVDWSVELGAGGLLVDVSAGGEAAEPAGEVDSCLEQADMSASAPTHNNRTLRFIRSPHYCYGTVTPRGQPEGFSATDAARECAIARATSLNLAPAAPNKAPKRARGT